MTTTKETPHIKPNGVEIAESILLPGDPLRAKFIAETFLEDYQCFNEVRGMLGYTGTYKGKKISVMGTGMGPASMGIYSWELINVFGVKNLIRIGTCGAMQENIELYDVIFGMGAATDSNYGHQFNLPGQYPLTASFELLEKAKKIADDKGQKVHIGNILGVEMESVALYWNAIQARVNALCILTVSDHLITGAKTTSEERQTAFTKMMEIALELA